ncbi:MAG: hypothetical protein HFG54_12575 [Lachnospiraceae bacterium]|jgi:hypothetical protein|nr:hypothetical protein [Lachnospiraceae bacterium]
MEEERGIYLEDWKVRLEETDRGRSVIMRIAGRDKMENWIQSSPVKKVCLTFYGWQVFTGEPEEKYLLRPNNRLFRGERGLWGSLREDWSLLAERLPEKLHIFARLWEDFPKLCLEDPKMDREDLKAWCRRYRIGMDFQTLYLYVICLEMCRDKILWEEERLYLKRCQRMKEIKDEGMFLCFNKDYPYCYDRLYGDFGNITTGWEYKYISQEITMSGPGQIHVRASCECYGFPRINHMVISYNLSGENRIELTRAFCRWEFLKKVIHWSPEKKKLPDWFLDGELFLVNTGESALYISGIAGERMLEQGDAMRIQMEEG